MSTERRSSLVIGLLLLLVGGYFLAAQFFPQLTEIINLHYDWPVWVILAGGLFLVMSVVLRTPGLAVPACIVGGIGGILYYQQTTGDWASWAYAWALIPGFAGVGALLMNLLEGRVIEGLREGVNSILFSLVMFSVFGSFLGGPDYLDQLWPVLLILLGVWMLLRGAGSSRRRSKDEPEIIEQ